MIGIELQIVNLPEMVQGHERFLKANDTLLQNTGERAGEVAKGHVQHYAKFKRRTGKLQDKTDYRVVRLSGGRLVKIYSPLPYAAAIDGGAKPHIIRGKNGGRLKFKVKGQWRSPRQVKHPGNRAYRFLYNATDAGYRVMGQELTSGMSRLAQRF